MNGYWMPPVDCWDNMVATVRESRPLDADEVVADLRWWEDRVRCDRKVKRIPSLTKLSKRWGWSVKLVRKALHDVEGWAVAVHLESSQAMVDAVTQRAPTFSGTKRAQEGMNRARNADENAGSTVPEETEWARSGHGVGTHARGSSIAEAEIKAEPPTPKGERPASPTISTTGWGDTPKRVDRQAYAALTLRALAAITGSEPNPKRCKTDARRIWALARSLDWPDPAEFEAELLLVADAAKRCPLPLFARDIRAEGWNGGVDRSTHVSTVTVQSKFGDRLRAAQKWLKAPAESTSKPETDDTSARESAWRLLLSEARKGTQVIYTDDEGITPHILAALALMGGSRTVFSSIRSAQKRDALGWVHRDWQKAWEASREPATAEEPEPAPEPGPPQLRLVGGAL